VNFYRNSTHRNFLRFCLKFHFEYGEFSIRRVVPYLDLFPPIFYLEFLEPGSPPFDQISLNLFEINLNKS
jgi:hypothetical protein